MTNKEIINKIKDAGYKVIVRHVRPASICDGRVTLLLSRYEARNNGYVLHNNGGSTAAFATKPLEHGSVTFFTQADCSKKDQFCYKTGTRIALERLLTLLKL